MFHKSLSGHTHTLLAHFIPSERLSQKSERHLISLDDGDRLSAHFYPGSSDYIISLFHGLSGDIGADYMQRTAIQYLARGHNVLLVNHRGAGDGVGLAKNPYHSGRAEDVSQVVQYLRQKFPGKKQITAGFSMSGNIILYLLSGQRGRHLPEAAITVNAPINLLACSEILSRGFNRVYDLRFVRRLVEQRQLEISAWSRLLDIDNVYTAPLCGFKNGRHYYETCSAKGHVEKINIPTCVLAAADDPFIPVRDYREASWPDCVDVTIHPWGGHLGYMSMRKNQIGNHRWLDEYMVRSLDALLQKI